MSCVLVLLMSIMLSASVLFWVSLPLLLYQGARGYKEGNRVGYNMIQIKILSLLGYFTYIFIDIIIYAWGARHDHLQSSRWWTEP
jgi:hypothetical protein